MEPDLGDLLTPVLTPADDAVGLDGPWNPNLLIVIGALAGSVVTTGWLLARNERRLARPERVMPVAVGAAVLALGGAAIAAYLVAYGWPGAFPAHDPVVRRRLVSAQAIVAILFGLAVGATQKGRQARFVGSGGEAAPLFWPGLLAFSLGWIALRTLIVAWLFAFTFGKYL